MTVKELYESFGGDYNRAVQVMMNDTFITRMLSKFMQSNSYQDAIDNYEKKNLRGVFEACHSLKGVCGNLSITPLYEKASIVCEKTRAINDDEFINIDLEIDELKETYERIASLINNFLK